MVTVAGNKFQMGKITSKTSAAVPEFSNMNTKSSKWSPASTSDVREDNSTSTRLSISIHNNVAEVSFECSPGDASKGDAALHSLASSRDLKADSHTPNTYSRSEKAPTRGCYRRIETRRGRVRKLSEMLINMRSVFIACLRSLKKVVNSSHIGIFYAIISTLLLAFAHFAAQLSIISSTNLPEEEVVFIRSLGQVVMLTPFLLLFQSRILYGPEKWVHLTLLSLAGYLSYITLYYVLQLIPLSAALSISATCPFFASLLSVCILKEKFILMDMVCGVISFLGVLLIARPSIIFGKYGCKEKVFYENVSEGQYQLVYLIGCGVALVFALSRALYLVLGRKWSKDSQGQKLDTIVTVFYPSVFGVVLTPLLMMFTKSTFKIPSELYGACSLFSVGIVAALGLIFLMLSLKTLTPTVVGVIRNLEIIWAFLLQYLVLNITPTLWSVGGGLVIVGATVAASYREKISKAMKRKEMLTLLGEK